MGECEALNDFVYNEVDKRREILIEGDKSFDKVTIKARQNAWQEVLRACVLEFGANFELEELVSIWLKVRHQKRNNENRGTLLQNLLSQPTTYDAKESPKKAESVGLKKILLYNGAVKEEVDAFAPSESSTPKSIFSNNFESSNQFESSLLAKALAREVPNKRPLSPSTSGGNYLPKRAKNSGHVNNVLVREVLARAFTLVHKFNSTSRTPQANRARHKAWLEIQEIIKEETGAEYTLEQLQINWRVQRTKLDKSILDEAVNSCSPTFDDIRQQEQSNWNGTPNNYVQEMSAFGVSNFDLTPLLEAEPERITCSTVSSEVHEERTDETKEKEAIRYNLDNLMTLHAQYLEQSMELQTRQMELMTKYSQAVDTVLNGVSSKSNAD